MIRFTEAQKRDVVATADAETLGRVGDFVVDPEGQCISALRLDKVKGDARFVSWQDLSSFGQDVVTIPSVDLLRAAEGPREEKAGKDFGVLGKRVLTDSGRELGKVTDVEFDPATGRVTTLLTEREQVAGDRLRGVGSYAVVVRREQRGATST